MRRSKVREAVARFPTHWKELAWFLLAALLVARLCAAPHAYPVPYVEKQHGSVVNFTELPGDGHIKIYTVTGEEVISVALSPGQSSYQWPTVNASGKKVSTGVYIYVVDGAGQKTEGKLVVIR